MPAGAVDVPEETVPSLDVSVLNRFISPPSAPPEEEELPPLPPNRPPSSPPEEEEEPPPPTSPPSRLPSPPEAEEEEPPPPSSPPSRLPSPPDEPPPSDVSVLVRLISPFSSGAATARILITVPRSTPVFWAAERVTVSSSAVPSMGMTAESTFLTSSAEAPLRRVISPIFPPPSREDSKEEISMIHVSFPFFSIMRSR